MLAMPQSEENCRFFLSFIAVLQAIAVHTYGDRTECLQVFVLHSPDLLIWESLYLRIYTVTF